LSRRGALRDGVVAGAVGAVAGGIPSTIHALLTGGDALEATRAAGALAAPHEHRLSRLLPAAGAVHLSLSLAWGVVMSLGLRRPGVVAGAVSGLAIAALDLGVVGRRIPAIRGLAAGPQVADHVVFGAVAGLVLARRARSI